MGALSINGIASLGRRSSRSSRTSSTSATRTATTALRSETEEEFTAFLLDDLEETIEQAGPDTVAMVIMEPVQNAGGSFTPPAGYWRASARSATATGSCSAPTRSSAASAGSAPGSARSATTSAPTSSRARRASPPPTRRSARVIVRDAVAAPFLEGDRVYTHGITFGGHPVHGRDRAQEHRDHAPGAHRRARGREAGRTSATPSRSSSTSRSSGDLRGTGYFYALELVKDKETRETFSEEECETLLRGFLSPRLFEAGLICRADDRGDPVVQISPPLVAGQAEIDGIVAILGDVLAEASQKMGH